MAFINTSVKSNKGRPRVWIEGGKLARHGWTKGTRYDVIAGAEIGGDAVLGLIKNESGKYVVSGRTKQGKELPIIERNDQAFTIGDFITVSIGDHSIVYEK